MAIALPSELGAYLHIVLDNDDVAANLALEAATAVVEDYIQQRILSPDEPEEVRINGSGHPTLLLPGSPCSVTEVAVIEGDEEVILEEETDYYLDSAAGILYRLDGDWESGKGNIKVTLTIGREEIPPALKMVVIQMAARVWDQGLAASESMNGYTVTYGNQAGIGLTEYERAILDLYRLRSKTL